MPDNELPIEPSWKLIGVTPDMMDAQACNKDFPFCWRSSMAISVFEPAESPLQERLCEGRITFIKVTATITGYQPTREETELGFSSFKNVPVERLSHILDQYFACYGALLNISVHPYPEKEEPFSAYPHIIDVEPKNRDLIQAATEQGEILISSKSNVKTNKSFTHTESTETGWKLSATGSIGAAKGKAGEGSDTKKEGASGTGSSAIPSGGPGASITGEINHKNTETEQENWTVATDASRERQEKQGSNTQISQLYNLLSSYHIGTNHVQFLMLARPHTLQPTVNRTFVQGLREIEGVQEFLLIVARPYDMDGLCIEAHLETGHFPEGLIVEQPEEHFEENFETFNVIKHAGDSWSASHGSWVRIDTTHTVEGGWIVDTRPERGPDPGHPGMKEMANNSNNVANNPSHLEEYNYGRLGDGEVSVTGKIRGENWNQGDARFNRTYRVFTRSVEPRPVTSGDRVPVDTLIVTSRSLCACFKSGLKCPELPPGKEDPHPHGITYEQMISIPRSATAKSATYDNYLPTNRELLNQIKNTLTTNWRMPKRHSFKSASNLLDTDYFKDKIKELLPKDYLRRTLAEVKNINEKILDRFGKELTVGEVLNMDKFQFSKKLGMDMKDAAIERRKFLGILQFKTKIIDDDHKRR